eukprot:GCRY01001485.1.p1 GENE.GCRY01001485.1~~GCRY01001485.1.p1  ORF type:complete len:254 (+),score=24.19 GCRY01001485.1:126-887(+)
MFRNQYDTDVTTFSPQGKLHQVEYATEAVKQGSAAIGVKGKKHVVLAALMRQPSELSAHQKKIFEIDDHCAIAISGLTADARSLSKYMRNESMNHRFIYDAPIPVGKLVGQIADKSQVHTQRAGSRPYGVGLLVAGLEKNGPCLFEFSPTADFFNYKAQAIGARSQAARTYLEKHLDSFPEATEEELLRHALLALQECLPTGSELTVSNVALGIIGANRPFTTVGGEQLQNLIDSIESNNSDDDDSDESMDEQ